MAEELTDLNCWVEGFQDGLAGRYWSLSLDAFIKANPLAKNKFFTQLGWRMFRIDEYEAYEKGWVEGRHEWHESLRFNPAPVIPPKPPKRKRTTRESAKATPSRATPSRHGYGVTEQDAKTL